MAHQDPVDPLSEFDTLLRQELSVEPSTSFLPTVRERIRAEPVAARWSGLWRLVPLAAAAALVLAIGVFVLSRSTDTNPAPAPIASAPSPTHAPTPPITSLPDLSAPNLEPRAPNPESRTANREPRTANSGQRTTDNGQRLAKEPEVIVDVRQREALQAFVRMINQGQLTGEKFQQTTPPPLDIEEAVTTIGVVPVSVSPIVVGGVLQGESGRK